MSATVPVPSIPKRRLHEAGYRLVESKLGQGRASRSPSRSSPPPM